MQLGGFSQVPREKVKGLTSRISLLAFGDVFSLNTLMATGIFTFSPSGIQMPWSRKKRTCVRSVVQIQRALKKPLRSSLSPLQLGPFFSLDYTPPGTAPSTILTHARTRPLLTL